MTIHSKDGASGSTKLDRISEVSARDNSMVFNNLGHLINLNLLKEQYYQLDGSKAVGIDGVTKESYGKQLEENLIALLQRIRRSSPVIINSLNAGEKAGFLSTLIVDGLQL